MITKEEFFNYLTEYQNFDKGINRLSEALLGKSSYSSLWEVDWIENVGKMLDIFISSHFTEEGIDWVDYYLFEDIKDKVVHIKQEKDMFNEEKDIEYHLNSIEELWNFLNTDKKLYFKNV